MRYDTAVSVCFVVRALQGGLCMSSRPSSLYKQVTPEQVWPALSTDLRTHVIRLFAHLALNVVVACPGDEESRKEVSHAEPKTPHQNRTIPS